MFDVWCFLCFDRDLRQIIPQKNNLPIAMLFPFRTKVGRYRQVRTLSNINGVR